MYGAHVILLGTAAVKKFNLISKLNFLYFLFEDCVQLFGLESVPLNFIFLSLLDATTRVLFMWASTLRHAIPCIYPGPAPLLILPISDTGYHTAVIWFFL